MNKLLATAAVGLALAATSAQALTTVELTNFSATWKNVQMFQGSATLDNTPNEISVSWGTPGSQQTNPDGEQSAYHFEWSPPIDVTFLDEFDTGPAGINVGTFTHINRAILLSGALLKSVDLEISFDVEVDGNPVVTTPTPLTGLYRFTHNETPNQPCGAPGCDDEVDIAGVSITALQDATFSFGGFNYILNILGFDDGVNPVPIATLFTKENANTSADLVGTLSRTAASREIPVPAALPLLATAMGVMGFAGWRRRRAA